MAPFSKPETVLKQAEGLVSVGQTHAALQSLTEMFASKRFRSTPLTSLEPIMHRFIELCVEMRKGRPAKEGLMQYKNIAQNTNVQSIESVITRFVQLADAKVREAQEKAQIEIQNQQVGLDVDDLEASETPESILLGAVSGDQSKDRTDRALVTPWLKFLWESYRTSLETLKNNARLEVIYQNIAQQAFKFCLTHQRKVEFRRLCETLRLHLSNVAKYSHQPHSINLSDPDTLQHHLDTRFAQLYTSVELELWQEAFRSVEDVHNLLTLAKKAPKPSMMANYYEKLTKIFLMSGNSLYHAAAWGKYYQIVTSMGGKSEEELSRLASQVLVSALAVPVGLQTPSNEGGSLSGDQDNDGEASSSSGKGRTGRLTALLGLSRTPNRSGLLRDALSRDVLRLVPPHIKSLYNILEITFDPLTLCSSIAPLLKTLSSEPDYKPYLPLLHQALLSRLLSHLSQIYSSMKLDALLDLTKPLVEQGVEGAYGETQVEAYIMGCARRGELNVRVDHKEGCLIFLDEAFGTSSPGASTSASASYGESGDRIQAPVSDLVRTRLSNVASCLYSSLQFIDPPPSTPSPSSEDHLTSLITAINTERRALSLRLSLTHRRRELVSELVIRKEKEESFRRSEQSRLAREASERKAREELRLREAERNKRERERIRVEEAKKYAQGLVETGLLKEEELEKMKESMGERFDTENLISIQVTQLEKEKRETSTKLKTIAKRLDHLERAYRKEERPLLEMDYERQQLMDRQTFDAVQIARKEGARAKFKEDIATKARLGRMLGDYEKRRDELVGKKKDEYERRKEVARKKIEEEKAKRRKAFEEAEREEKRQREEEERTRREKEEEERRLEEERLAEEERQREEAEAAARAEEEAKRAAEEKVAKARKDREAERAAAIEQARLQQQREEEAEERRRQRKTTAPTTSTAPTGSVGRAGGDNVWRRGTNVASNGASTTPPRTESPAPGAAGKYRPGAFSAASGGGGGGGGGGGATGGGWRAREEARRAAAGEGGASTPRPESPAPAKAQEKDDGFQVVGAKKEGVWRPRRGR